MYPTKLGGSANREILHNECESKNDVERLWSENTLNVCELDLSDDPCGMI